MKNVLPPVTIREAVPADAARLIAHVTALAEEPGVMIALYPGEFSLTVEQEQEFIAEVAASENSIFLVAEAQGHIVGVTTCFGGRRQATRHAAEIGMSVEQGWRNLGIGSQMMQVLVEWAQRNPLVSRLELKVYVENEPARRLYEKFGFQVEGRRRKAIYRDGIYYDDLLMARLF